MAQREYAYGHRRKQSLSLMFRFSICREEKQLIPI